MLLAIYQVIGGLIGLFYCYNFIYSQPNNFSAIAFALIGTFFYLFSIFCGLLIQIKNNLLSLKLSSLNQILQVVNFSIAGFGFKYVSGIVLSIGINYMEDFLLTSNFNVSEFLLNINVASEVSFLNLNLVAVFLIYYIDRLIEMKLKKINFRDSNSIN